MSRKAQQAGMMVTLVDDEPLVLDLLAHATQAWQFECQTATSAEQALQLLEKCPTPIVVTDLNMPGHNGVWLVREIKKRWPRAITILITCATDTVAALECLNAGADRYFTKPLRLPELRQALETAFHHYQLEQAQDRMARQMKKRVRLQTRTVRKNCLVAFHNLVRTLEARDACNSGHSLRVRQYGLQLGKALGVDRVELRQISLAAKLHDIGKVAIPEMILNKPGLLTEEEFALVREHPIIGERILAPLVHDRAVLAGIRNHHERYDGKGYPDKLAGADIPMVARIISLCDSFDALTSWRAYREGLSVTEALETLRVGAGTQFDPQYAHLFVKVIEQNLAREGKPAKRDFDMLRRDLRVDSLSGE